MTRLPEALEKEKETLSEETPTLAESQSTSSGESITLYDWFGSDSVSSNSVQVCLDINKFILCQVYSRWLLWTTI